MATPPPAAAHLTGSVVTIILAATAGAGLYALGARGLRIAEFGELTAAMRTRGA
jgi:hypothetical protein